MKWSNYHTHSKYDDGKGTVEQYVQKAIESGMYALGFSGHSPVPFETEWNMRFAELDDYFADVREAKQKYEGQIKIFQGMEVDFLANRWGVSRFSQLLDYSIGSVHFIGKKPDGQDWSFDYHTADFQWGLQTIFGGDIRYLVNFYYDQVALMLQTNCPDVLGHFDLVKKFNDRPPYFFDENDVWYKQKALETLQIAANKNVIVEVNTRGVFRGLNNEFYPSGWLLQECKNMGIRLTISADAHSPDEVCSLFEPAAKAIQKAGYNEIYVFDEAGWHAQQLIV